MLALLRCSTIMQQVVLELLLTCPLQQVNADGLEWGDNQCDHHGRCVTSVKNTWPSLHRKVTAGSPTLALTGFRALLEQFTFASMSPNCRLSFITQVHEMASEFHEELLEAITDYLVAI